MELLWSLFLEIRQRLETVHKPSVPAEPAMFGIIWHGAGGPAGGGGGGEIPSADAYGSNIAHNMFTVCASVG